MIYGALCVGVALQLLFFKDLLAVYVSVALACLLFLFSFFIKTSKVLFIGLLLAAIAIGGFRAYITQKLQASETLSSHIDEKALIIGKIIEDPDRRDTSLHITVSVLSVNSIKTTGKLLAYVPRESQVAYGDTIQLRGKIAAPQSFKGTTGHTFDYPHYLEARDITAIVSFATLEKVSSGGFSFLRPLYALRHIFESSLEKLFVEPNASLMEGILLGEKHGIPQTLTETFIQSGLVHVVVLSGYNIAVVSTAVSRVLMFLPRTFGLATAGVFMTVFALMTGAGAATVRALLMALIVLIAKYLRRPTIALRSLVFAATGMALWSPLSMLYDSGFILSVLATFGLVTLSPWVEGWLPKILKRNKTVQEIASTTIAVQIYTLPALLYFSGVFSLVSVPANIIALPVIPFAMLGGFIAGMLGLINPLLGFIPALIADILLRWFLLVAHVAASIPLGSIIIGEFSPLILVVAYIPLTWFATLKYQQTAGRVPPN